MATPEPNQARLVNTTLRRIGYAAVSVGGAAAAVCAIANGIRKRDLSCLWGVDPVAAPPRDVQDQLQLGETSEMDARCRSSPMEEIQEDQKLLEAHLERAMRARDTDRVRFLSREMEELDDRRAQMLQDLQRLQSGDRCPMSRSGGFDRPHGNETHSRFSQHSSVRPPSRTAHQRSTESQNDFARGGEQQWWEESRGLSAQHRWPDRQPRWNEQSRDYHSSSHWESVSSQYPAGRHERFDAPAQTQRSPAGQCKMPRMQEQHAQISECNPRRSERFDRHGDSDRKDGRKGEACATPKEPRADLRKGRSREMPTARRSAMAKLKQDDLVKAECPISGAWQDATVLAIHDNGLIEIRWHDPGTQPDGRPFQPCGDVWAENVRCVFRRRSEGKDASCSAEESSESREEEKKEEVDLPCDLSIGSDCFAFGSSTIVEKQWFRAKLLGAHPSFANQVKVEFLSTLEGEKNPLTLPEPRKTYVLAHHVKRKLSEEEVKEVPGNWADGSPPQQERPVSSPGGGANEELVIDKDLMCSVCGRPDDEDKMLICDCKAGYHTYCLSPPLHCVPRGHWQCPNCKQD